MQVQRESNWQHVSQKRMIDIGAIKQPTQTQIITVGRVKYIYSTSSVEAIITNGPVTKEQLIKQLPSKQQSKSGYVYIVLQNIRKQANIFVKCDQTKLAVGGMYLFIGKVKQFYEDLFCLEGYLRKVEGSCTYWDRYLKLLDNFKLTEEMIQRQKKENQTSEVEKQKFEVIEIEDD